MLKKHLKNKVFYENSSYSYIEFLDIKERIAELREIELICKKNKIDLVIMFNPIHTRAYRDQKMKEDYSKIRETIKKEFEGNRIFDFSELNISENNNVNWFETSHFNSKIENKMLDTIFCDKNRKFKYIENRR